MDGLDSDHYSRRHHDACTRRLRTEHFLQIEDAENYLDRTSGVLGGDPAMYWGCWAASDHLQNLVGLLGLFLFPGYALCRTRMSLELWEHSNGHPRSATSDAVDHLLQCQCLVGLLGLGGFSHAAIQPSNLPRGFLFPPSSLAGTLVQHHTRFVAFYGCAFYRQEPRHAQRSYHSTTKYTRWSSWSEKTVLPSFPQPPRACRRYSTLSCSRTRSSCPTISQPLATDVTALRFFYR